MPRCQALKFLNWRRCSRVEYQTATAITINAKKTCKVDKVELPLTYRNRIEY